MSRLAFAIARDRPDLPDLVMTTRSVVDGLAIIHGPSPVDVRVPGLESLQAFAETVATLHARETVLPLRFGSIHDDEASLQAVLSGRIDDWRALLDQVEGCEEMGLRVLLDRKATNLEPDRREPGPPRIAGRPGMSYLEARRAELAVQDALVNESSRVEARILAAYQALSRRSVVDRPGPGRENLLSMAFLVPRDNLDAFRDVTRDLFLQGLGKLLPTGPWPPYHFANADHERQLS